MHLKSSNSASEVPRPTTEKPREPNVYTSPNLWFQAESQLWNRKSGSRETPEEAVEASSKYQGLSDQCRVSADKKKQHVGSSPGFGERGYEYPYLRLFLGHTLLIFEVVRY